MATDRPRSKDAAETESRDEAELPGDGAGAGDSSLAAPGAVAAEDVGEDAGDMPPEARE